MAEQSVNVRCSNGEKFTVPLDTDATVQAFKESIAEEAQVPSESQRLIYKGRVLKDEQTLASYGKKFICLTTSLHLLHWCSQLLTPALRNLVVL
jgi:Ubiquitin family